MKKNMILIATALIISTSSLSAKTKQINYDINFGLFGNIGMLNTTLTKSKNSYTIDTKMNVAGVAKYLLGSHTERHISKGHMEGNKMVSDLYQMIQKYGETVENKEYWIDHKRKKVTKIHKKWKNSKLVKDKKVVLNFYAKDDLLTLYFNLNVAIGKTNHNSNKKYIFKAVGLEKQSGIVEVEVAGKKSKSEFTKELGVGSAWYAKALIHQKNFTKKKGDIFLSVAKDTYIQKAIIKDVIMYGDVEINRVR